MADTINWALVSAVYNGIIEESREHDAETAKDNIIQAHLYSPMFDQTLKVIVPTDRVEEFMKRLGLWEAEVYPHHPQKQETRLEGDQRYDYMCKAEDLKVNLQMEIGGRIYRVHQIYDLETFNTIEIYLRDIDKLPGNGMVLKATYGQIFGVWDA